jgi:hypothetical protein
VRSLLVVGLLLLAPATAAARQPVISYVDGAGTFRLYDEELEAEVEPPPPVPANFAGFRYGMSLGGRYVVFNDADKKLHLLDRATKSQLPLPGIDVYANPGSLTVSDTGLIAFDDNGNGPAVVYDSSSRQFADTGLLANNGHRQTRLSGDGRFLAMTCNDSNCGDDLDTGADPYIQDLSTKLDTGFPHDANADEEHPCIDADGSVVGLDKRPSAADMQPDIFLFDRSVSPPAPIAFSGVNTADEPDAFCVLDAAGEYLGYLDNNTEFRVLHVPTSSFVSLPPGKDFGIRSLFSSPYSPPTTGNGGNATPPPDVTAPVASRVRMSRRRLGPRRRGAVFRFVLSEPADVRIRIRRAGRTLRTIARAGRPAGANAIRFNGRARGRFLKRGRYAAVLDASDAAGNAAKPRVLRFRVIRNRAAR